MGSRKKFERRTPQYAVFTKVLTEKITAVDLKIRDMQIIYKIMVDQGAKYVQAIETQQARCGSALDLNAPIPAAAKSLENVIRIQFSAFLSTFESVIYYLRESLEKDEVANEILTDRRRNDAMLNGLQRLRNMDIHHEPLQSYIGTRFRLIGTGRAFSSLETREVHHELELRHEGPGLYPGFLSESKHFSSQPGLVDIVCFESLTQLVHTGTHAIIELTKTLSEATPLVTLPNQCLICIEIRKHNESKSRESTGSKENEGEADHTS